MNKIVFKKLWEKYHNGTLLPEEWVVFESLLHALDEKEIGEVIDTMIEVDMNLPYDSKKIFDQIEVEIDKSKRGPIVSYRWIKYAAASVLLFGSLYFLKDYMLPTVENDSKTIEVQFTGTKDDISLQDNGVSVLRLQNGQTYSVKDNMSALETDGVKITSLSGGVFTFEVKEGKLSEEIFHEFETPKGVSNQLLLADGTKVWLNAMSKLEVSSNYGGKGTRQVRLEGEAYFEVAHDEKRPFCVTMDGTKVEVLGTSFNIRNRGGANGIATTLAEGSVVMKRGGVEMFLAPGEQGYSQNNSNKIQKRKVNVDQILAWKNGYFNFVDTPIDEIVEELVNWYDIEEIEWRSKNTERLTVSLSRTRSLNELLKKIEMISQLRLTIKERRIIVQ